MTHNWGKVCPRGGGGGGGGMKGKIDEKLIFLPHPKIRVSL